LLLTLADCRHSLGHQLERAWSMEVD